MFNFCDLTPLDVMISLEKDLVLEEETERHLIEFHSWISLAET